MKGLTMFRILTQRVLTPLLITTLVCAGVTPAGAQRRGTRKRTGTPPAKVQAQPPQPIAPQKTEEEIAIEQELTLLSPMTAASKAAVRVGLAGLDRYVRLYQVRGYDENWTYSDEPAKLDKLLTNAYAALPQESYLRQVIILCVQATIDVRSAEFYYRCRCGDDKLLALVAKYKLEGMAGVLLGNEIFKAAVDLLNYATALAQRAGIMSILVQ